MTSPFIREDESATWGESSEEFVVSDTWNSGKQADPLYYGTS